MDLKFVPGLPNAQVLPHLLTFAKEDRAALRGTVTSQNPGQNRVMLRYADDASRIYGETVIPWDPAYALTSVLAGKNLSNDRLAPLNGAIVEAVGSAFACRNNQSDLGKSSRPAPLYCGLTTPCSDWMSSRPMRALWPGAC